MQYGLRFWYLQLGEDEAVCTCLNQTIIAAITETSTLMMKIIDEAVPSWTFYLQERLMMTPIERRQKGYQALVDNLGIIDAIQFLQQAGWGAGDYTAEGRQQLASVTRQEFWQDIQRIRARKTNSSTDYLED